jgi:hypothetical protein
LDLTKKMRTFGENDDFNLKLVLIIDRLLMKSLQCSKYTLLDLSELSSVRIKTELLFLHYYDMHEEICGLNRMTNYIKFHSGHIFETKELLDLKIALGNNGIDEYFSPGENEKAIEKFTKLFNISFNCF